MSTLVEQVQSARTPREALLVLASAIDELRAARPAVDPWDSWGASDSEREFRETMAGPSGLEFDRPKRKVSEAEVRDWIEANYNTEVDADDADMRRVIAMVRRDLQKAGDPAVATDYVGVVDSQGILELDWSPKSDDHRKQRYEFAKKVLDLDTAFGPHPEGGDWAADYAQQGPMPYYVNNRELLVDYPENVKAVMVADVNLYSERAGTDMALDLLKVPIGADGPNHNSPAMRLGDDAPAAGGGADGPA